MIRIFFLFLLFCGALQADTDMVWLSWQSDPTRTMTIQWAGHPIDPHTSIEYKHVRDKSWCSSPAFFTPFPGLKNLQINRVELTNLQPNSAYEFRLGKNSTIYKFRTLPSNTNEKVVFVEGGDIYHDDIETMEKMSQVAAQQNPHFAVMGGDLAYSCGRKQKGECAERWADWLKSMKKTMVTKDGFMIPLVAAIGNHEVVGGFNHTSKEAKLFYATFPLSNDRAYRVLDFGNYLSLFLLDSGHTAAITGAQQEWLKETLKSRVNRPFKFAVYHVPAYPSIRSFTSRSSTAVRQNWVPIFDTYALDVAFEHHDHAYKRSLRLCNNQPSTTGTLYMGDGCWGIKEPRKNSIPRWYIVHFQPKRNVLAVTMHHDKYWIRAIGEDGQVFDEATSLDLRSMAQSVQTRELAPTTAPR